MFSIATALLLPVYAVTSAQPLRAAFKFVVLLGARPVDDRHLLLSHDHASRRYKRHTQQRAPPPRRANDCSSHGTSPAHDENCWVAHATRFLRFHNSGAVYLSSLSHTPSVAVALLIQYSSFNVLSCDSRTLCHRKKLPPRNNSHMLCGSDLIVFLFLLQL